MNQENFESAKKKAFEAANDRTGIGTLAEKTVHAVFKYYYEPNEDHQEIPIQNYVADIYTGTEIIEIQTRQFSKMRNKLSAFLPLYPVTIVHPIPYEKWLIWIDQESGELTKKRKSPKKGNMFLAFPELYRIKTFLKDPNLRLRLVLTDMEEYRILNGWSKNKKKGSTRYDRMPLNLLEEAIIESPNDYKQFLPQELPNNFTTKDFAQQAHIPQKLAGTVVHILHHVEAIERVGKQGNYHIYQIKTQT